MNSNQLQPTGDRVLVERDKHVREMSPGGLFLVGGKKLDVCVSKVLALGPDVKTRKWDLAVGMYVLHVRVAGVKYDSTLGRYDGDGDLLFLHESELLATVDPGAVVEGVANYDGGASGMRDLAAL